MKNGTPGTMLKSSLVIATLLGTTLFGSTTLFAADNNGMAVSNPPARTRQITITEKTKYVNASYGQVLSFKLPDGSNFSWKFDGGANYVNLQDIAPKGSMAPNIRVYVGENPNDNGE